jgi:mannose-1-phosphate guanylyltransferase
VVAVQHRWWWESPLAALPKENIFVQPENRGTAHGLLLALLRLEARDPRAIVLMLPSDHHIQQETLFARSLRRLAELAARTDDAVFLLGADPDRTDTELGYIVPAERKRNRPMQVQSFIEKPDFARARALLRAGALWNMFIIAGSVRALLELYDLSLGSSVALLRTTISRKKPPVVDNDLLAAIYRRLPTLDFSRHVLEPQAARLQVLGVPPCGWNDLRTPKRVVDTLTNVPDEFRRLDTLLLPSAALSLADQYGRLSRDMNQTMHGWK